MGLSLASTSPRLCSRRARRRGDVHIRQGVGAALSTSSRDPVQRAKSADQAESRPTLSFWARKRSFGSSSGVPCGISPVVRTKKSTRDPFLYPPPTAQRSFHLNPDMLGRLKELASGSTEAPDCSCVSTIDSLTALMIVLITRAHKDMRVTTCVKARALLPDAFVRPSFEHGTTSSLAFISSQSDMSAVSISTEFFFGPDLFFMSWVAWEPTTPTLAAEGKQVTLDFHVFQSQMAWLSSLTRCIPSKAAWMSF
ncbi:hypothetical protein PC117_g21462 [Phytophthora cactorum]|uniref:Uncharacterized protein n=1 Tax=Phytophthora cactorum TaxID=29920 RepID=A0A8T1BIH9_9STRA|nr:hypothetical protein PC117_g21462 [Phytophthora cactorum]